MNRDLPMGIDFAALHTLCLVYNLRSFTAAAAELDVNQSAVSYTIDKLRRAFSDPLFFRQGGEVIATKRCETVVKQAAEMLERFEAMVMPTAFDPATADGSVVIACNLYERTILMPTVIRGLRRSAPGLRITIAVAGHRGPDLLKKGSADLLMGPITPDESDFFSRRLLSEHYVCVMDPSRVRLLGKDDYAAANHVTISFGGDYRSPYIRAVEDDGRKMNEVMRVPSHAALTETIMGTDLIATIPSRLARTMGDKLATVPCPYPSPFDLHMVWTTRARQAPMHSWLRDRILDTARWIENGHKRWKEA